MALKDYFVTDPILKRARRMAEIEKQLAEEARKRRATVRAAQALTEEFDLLKAEIKSLRKTGSTDSVRVQPKGVA